MGFLEDIKNKTLIADGAMGTLLYSYGIDRCFEELNISKPEEIRRVHEAYVQAGADIIQTNTYGANFIKLSRYGLEDETKQINEKAVRLARAAAGSAYVLGTLGGIRTFNKNSYSLEDIKRSFREQLYLLLNGLTGRTSARNLLRFRRSARSFKDCQKGNGGADHFECLDARRGRSSGRHPACGRSEAAGITRRRCRRHQLPSRPLSYDQSA